MSKINYEYALSVLDKAENGPVVEQADWDRTYIGKKAQELLKEFDIRWDDDEMVPSDDSLADRLFEAGLKLAVESGLWCINTQRQMVWTKDEILGALESAPAPLTVGLGDDQATIIHREPEEEKRTIVLGGAYGTLIEEDYFLRMVQAYAQEPLVDIVETPSLLTTRGRTIRIDSPWEAVTGWQEAELAHEAIRRAGRPGVCVAAAGTSGTELIELGSCTYGGFRQSDWHHASLISENKVSYGDLTRAIHFLHTGSIAHTFVDPIYGGYYRGKEGLALGCVAGVIMQRAALFADTTNAGPSHAHLALNTHPKMIPAQAVAFQAISRNTHLLNGVHIRPASGPGTRQIFDEVAALAIAAVTSGVSFLKTVQSATGRHMGHTTPIEVRFAAQVAHAVEGMTRQDANKISTNLVSKYEPHLKTENLGKTFQELYQLDSLTPTPEWLTLYETAVEDFNNDFDLAI
jgi:methylamine---corrinoid protein Co-methyltransferase